MFFSTFSHPLGSLEPWLLLKTGEPHLRTGSAQACGTGCAAAGESHRLVEAGGREGAVTSGVEICLWNDIKTLGFGEDGLDL